MPRKKRVKNSVVKEDISTGFASSGKEKLKNENLLDKYKCTKTLKIYTTRLDDMNAITKDIYKSNTKLFMECIVNESKPIYNERFIRPEPYFNKLMSYLILKHKIYSYNSLIQFNKIYQSKQKINKTYTDSYSASKKKTVSNFDDNDDLAFLSKLELNTDVSRKHKNISHKYLIIKDEYSNETDIYFFNKHYDVTQHYKSTDKNYSDLKYYYDEFNTVKLNHCCWFKKVSDIVSSHALIRYIRKPHKCALDNCICCCKELISTGQNNYIENIENPSTGRKAVLSATITPANKLENFNVNIYNQNIKIEKTPCTDNKYLISSITQAKEDGSQNLFTKLSHAVATTATASNLIKKAFESSTVIYSNKNPISSCSTQLTKPVVIQINNSKTKICQLYKIGHDNEIEDYFTIKDYKYTGSYILNDYDECDKMAINVCCWYARKNFVDKLRLRKLSRSSLNLISSNHTCPESACQCCCVNVSQSNNKITHNELTSLDMLHTSTKVNKMLTLNINFAPVSLLNKKIFKYAITNKSFGNENDVGTCITDSEMTSKSTDSVHSEPSTSNTSIVSTEQLPDNTQPSADSSEVQILIQKILHKFKDIQLVVNAAGKIQAQFNSSINHLNANDLQLLRQILAQAQNEIDAINKQAGNVKIGPGNSQPTFIYSQESRNIVPHQLSQNVNIDINQACNISTVKVNDKYVPSMPITNTFDIHDFSSLMYRKKECYLNAFQSFLTSEINMPTPIITNVCSWAQYNTNTQPTKRKAVDEQELIKRTKVDGYPELLTSSNEKNSSSEIQYLTNAVFINSNQFLPFIGSNVDGLKEEVTEPLLSSNDDFISFEHLTSHIKDENEINDTTEVDIELRKIDSMPQPISVFPSPILQNLLDAPAANLRCKNVPVINVLTPNVIQDFAVPGTSKSISTRNVTNIMVNIHDDVLVKEELDIDDAILGV